MVEVAIKHEFDIIDKLFEFGEVDGVSSEQLKAFVKSRANLVLSHPGFHPLYNVDKNPIAEWFYPSITNYSSNDFFTGIGREYKRTWDQNSFKWSV
jgi:ribonucleotide reductase beta subunit family protein with ferritin-like domain